MSEQDEAGNDMLEDAQHSKTVNHSEYTETTEHNVPAVNIIQQASKAWPAALVDSLKEAANKIGALNLISLILVSGLVFIGVRVSPSLVNFLDEAKTNMPIQTELMRDAQATNKAMAVTMEDIKAQNKIRNENEIVSLKVQESQATAITAVSDLEKTALENHKKIIDNQSVIVRAEADIVELLHRMANQRTTPEPPIPPTKAN